MWGTNPTIRNVFCGVSLPSRISHVLPPKTVIDAKTEIYKISAWKNIQLARLMPGGFSKHLRVVSPPLFKLFSVVLVYLAALVTLYRLRQLIDAKTEVYKISAWKTEQLARLMLGGFNRPLGAVPTRQFRMFSVVFSTPLCLAA